MVPWGCPIDTIWMPEPSRRNMNLKITIDSPSSWPFTFKLLESLSKPINLWAVYHSRWSCFLWLVYTAYKWKFLAFDLLNYLKFRFKLVSVKPYSLLYKSQGHIIWTIFPSVISKSCLFSFPLLIVKIILSGFRGKILS